MRHLLSELEFKILDKLVEYGYEAMVVGGAVRDYLLDRPFNDVDIATNAPYDVLTTIMEDLGELKLAGKQFGVLLVDGVEVATYRRDINEENKTIGVINAPSSLEDSKRRDFTINALYYNFATDSILNYHNGSKDIYKGIIRAVGKPQERFKEDYSRILRALHLSATLGFEIELETAKAIRVLGRNINKIPNALIGKIVRKSISTGKFHKFLELLQFYDLLKHIFPEVVHLVGLEQNPVYHKYDAWEHTLEVVKHVESYRKGDVAFVIGALLHDIAKGLKGVRGVNKDGQPSDLGHEKAGVPIAKSICKRLELGKYITHEVCMYVEWHGAKIVPTEKSVRRFLLKFKDVYRDIDSLKHGFMYLMDFKYVDALAFEDDFSNIVIFDLNDIKRIAFREVFESQIFYSSQFEFSASIIANHPYVKPNEVKELIDFFIKQNIKDEHLVVKVLNKRIDNNVK